MTSTLYSRRDFLKGSLALAAAATTIPSFLAQTVLAATADIPSGDRVLVIIQLSGGNDGLNTIIPYQNDHYYRARPTLAIGKTDALSVNDEVAFHPAMAGMTELLKEGKLAVIQGVGYPNPDRSHFRSMEIWHSAMTDDYAYSGWIGRLFDHSCSNSHLTSSPTLAASIDDTLNPALLNTSGIGVALRDPEKFYKLTKFAGNKESPAPIQTTESTDTPLDFLRRTALNAQSAAADIRNRVRTVRNQVDYPRSGLARDLGLIARMIAGGMNTRVYYAALGGFDTHAQQLDNHANLLGQLSEAISAFQLDCEKLGIADRVLGFTFSEFGRRVAENGSRGTDHGQAAPSFLFGSQVKGGVYNDHPDLSPGKLSKGDITYNTDFRQLYATMLDQWLLVPHQPVLKARYTTLPLLQTS